MDLKSYLQRSGIMQKHFANKIGISPNFLGSLLKGKIPNLVTALAIEIATEGHVTCKELIPEKIRKEILNRVKTMYSLQMEESPEENTGTIKTNKKKNKEK